MLNLRLAALAVAVTSVAFVALTMAYAPRPEAQSSPSISISGLVNSMDVGDSASFTVNASNLRSFSRYSIQVKTSNNNIGFNSSCSTTSQSKTLGTLVTSGDMSLTLYGCNTPGGTVTATLSEVGGNGGDSDSVRGDSTTVVSRAVIDTDSQYVTVRRPSPTPTPTPTSTPTPTPNPSIVISGLVNSMKRGNSDSFTVKASNLSTLRRYSIQVETSNNIGFDNTCDDTSDSKTLGTLVTSGNMSLTLYGCSSPGGTVTATLCEIGDDSADSDSVRGSSKAVNCLRTVDTDSQYVTVFDPTIMYGSSNYSVNEGSLVSITVSLSMSTAQNLTIPITVTGGTAGSTDYTVPRSVMVSSGASSATFSLTSGDPDCDDDTVILGFGTPPSGWAIGSPSTTTVTIRDDDKCIMYGSSSYSVNEGSSVSVTVSLSESTSQALTIPITVTGGTAGSTDYTVPSTVTVSSGASSATFSLTSNDPDCYDDTVILGFGTPPSGWGIGSPSSTTVTINDDEACVMYGSSSYSVNEGSSVSVAVTLSQTTSSSLPITITATRGSAESGDYTVTGSVTVSGGKDRETFSLSVNQDDDCDNETVILGFGTPPSGWVIGTPSTTTVTIIDDDAPSTCVPPPIITIARHSGTPDSVVEGHEVRFVLSASYAPTRNLTVNVSVTQSVAQPPEDADFLTNDAPTEITLARDSTTADIILPTEDDSVDEEDGEITATVQQGSGYRVGIPSSASVNVQDNDLPPLAAPTNFDVTPLPSEATGIRRARLSWESDSEAASHIVQVRDPEVINNAVQPWNNWTSHGGATCMLPDSQTGKKTCSTRINLDKIFNVGGRVRGFAQANAYELRVKAISGNQTHGDSEFSKRIRIIDTPIKVANGDSRGLADNIGKAVIQWSAVPNVTGYKIRWRELPGKHSDISWTPQEAQRPDDWSYPDDDPDALLPSGLKHTIDGLTQGDLYAIQLNYEYSYTAESGSTEIGQGFSVREAYVWPSDVVGGVGQHDGERVATFPLTHPMPDKTYTYRVCQKTFPDEDEGDDWKKFIEHAFSQWDLATRDPATNNSLVTTKRDEGECADYSMFVGEVRDAVTSFVMDPDVFDTLTNEELTDGEIEEYVGDILEDILDRFEKLGIYSPRARDALISEVLMFDDRKVDGANSLLVKASVFWEVANTVGHGVCERGRPACAMRNTDNPRPTVDIKISRENFMREKYNFKLTLDVPGTDSTADEGEIRFNTCAPHVHSRYGVLVHEAGHALGIGGGKDGSGQGRYHANDEIVDSVMSYGRMRSLSCSPLPLDVMAMYALYQVFDVETVD